MHSLLIYVLEAPIQLLSNREDHAIAHLTSYFAFFFILQCTLYRESPPNWQFLFCGQTIEEKHIIISSGSHGHKLLIIFDPIASFAFHGLFCDHSKFLCLVFDETESDWFNSPLKSILSRATIHCTLCGALFT